MKIKQFLPLPHALLKTWQPSFSPSCLLKINNFAQGNASSTGPRIVQESHDDFWTNSTDRLGFYNSESPRIQRCLGSKVLYTKELKWG
ncbi:unnamed protein product [Lactuca virosa]|uniref:Uncharacterized protein n=1 Tax=Lactuca virosa TaxID=75947 RepID=A0AAU9LJB8_9ASTR|nr:unnamed protein product [Lactuca virosa]